MPRGLARRCLTVLGVTRSWRQRGGVFDLDPLAQPNGTRTALDRYSVDQGCQVLTPSDVVLKRLVDLSMRLVRLNTSPEGSGADGSDRFGLRVP